MQTWFRRCSTLAGLALLTVAATPAAAQKKASLYGFLAGADFTTIVSGDPDVTYKTSTGFVGGFFADIPVGTSLYIEPEFLYTNKGVNYEGADLTANLNYIEIPVLARYEFSADGGPFAYAGPYVGFNVKCNVVVDTLPVPCDEIDGNPQPNTVFGGAVGIGYQKDKWGFDIRYEYDFTTAIKDEDGKNSAIMVLLRLVVN